MRITRTPGAVPRTGLGAAPPVQTSVPPREAPVPASSDPGHCPPPTPGKGEGRRSEESLEWPGMWESNVQNVRRKHPWLQSPAPTPTFWAPGPILFPPPQRPPLLGEGRAVGAGREEARPHPASLGPQDFSSGLTGLWKPQALICGQGPRASDNIILVPVGSPGGWGRGFLEAWDPWRDHPSRSHTSRNPSVFQAPPQAKHRCVCLGGLQRGVGLVKVAPQEANSSTLLPLQSIPASVSCGCPTGID